MAQGIDSESKIPDSIPINGTYMLICFALFSLLVLGCALLTIEKRGGLWRVDLSPSAIIFYPNEHFFYINK